MDLNAIKERLNQLQTTNRTSNSLWKPPNGKTQIRIVPYKFNKENPFIELYFNYGLGEKTYLSPISFGRPDPVEEFSRKLKSTGNRDEWIFGKRLEPKMRTFAPMIVRGEESQGVKFWGFGKTVYQEILGFITDPDYGDITDPINGRDIVVERMSPAEAGNQFGKTTIRVKPNQTAITEDKSLLESIFNSQVEITDVYTEPSYDDLKEALQSYLDPDSGNASDSKSSDGKESSNLNGTKPPKTESVPGKASNVEVEDAFDKLFND